MLTIFFSRLSWYIHFGYNILYDKTVHFCRAERVNSNLSTFSLISLYFLFWSYSEKMLFSKLIKMFSCFYDFLIFDILWSLIHKVFLTCVIFILLQIVCYHMRCHHCYILNSSDYWDLSIIQFLQSVCSCQVSHCSKSCSFRVGLSGKGSYFSLSSPNV